MVSEKMNGRAGPTTWPCLLPKKKIRCYRRHDPEKRNRLIIQQSDPDREPYREPDRISFLPDAIQSLILEFLPIKDAFKTSVLSEKWTHHCHTLRSLSFFQSQMVSTNPQMKIEHVIDQVLRHYKQPSIDMLRIVLNDPVPHNHMDEWLSFAVSHHVQTLIFWGTANRKAIYTFPSSVFSCASLKVLKLTNMFINSPTETVFLPSLIFLELYRCVFTNAVFSTCNYPKLGQLVIRYCKFDTLSISSSALHLLQIFQTVNSPRIDLLSIPNLTRFDYLEKDPPNVSLESLLCLQSAYFIITISHFGSWDLVCKRSSNLVGKMLKGLHSVRDLTVGSFFIECLRVNWGPRCLDYPVAPCFSSVNCLSLGYSGKRHVPVLKVLLRSYPNLVHLEIWCKARPSFEESTEDDNNTAQYWEEKGKERLPANFLNSLVTCTAGYGQDTESEFELIKFVVENANALRNINVSVGAEVEINEENLHQKLKTFSQERGSQVNVVISRHSK